MKKVMATVLMVWLFLATLHYQPIKAATLCVNPGGTGGCYSSISAAVAAASAGDTINVAAGVYNAASGETFATISKNLTFQGAGAAATIINATGVVAATINVSNATVNISGFTITGGVHGISYCIGSGGIITNNIIIGNYNDGIYSSWSSPIITNNIIIGNTRMGIYVDASNATVTNNTITGNGQDGIYNDWSWTWYATNNIIVSNVRYGIRINNGNPPLGNGHNDVWGNIIANYSGMTDPTGTNGNISANPLFVGGGIYHLQVSSPALNAGDNSAPAIPTTDMDGNPRISCGIVDMGAYEIQCPKHKLNNNTPSILPLASTNMSKANDLAKQADELLSQAKSKNLDTATCEKLISEANELIEKAHKVKASPITANYFAIKALEKLKSAIDCLKALIG